MFSNYQYDYPEFEKDGLPPVIETVDVPSGYCGKLAYMYYGDLRVLDLETGLRKHYSGAVGMISPSWHPAGEWLACGNGDIYLLNTETNQFINATHSPYLDMYASWSPDGEFIVFARNAHSKQELSGLYRRRVDTLEVEKLPLELNHQYHPCWSPNGHQITFAGSLKDEKYPQIQVLDVSCVSTGACATVSLTQPPKQNQYPSWSPDGRQIVFESKRDGLWAIYVMNADGSNQQRITENPDKLNDNSPCWSSDGEFITFIRREIVGYKTIAGRQRPREGSNIYVMRPDGSEVTRVVADGGGEPAWWMDTSDMK